MTDEQEWCLACGAAVGTRVVAAPGWRAPIDRRRAARRRRPRSPSRSRSSSSPTTPARSPRTRPADARRPRGRADPDARRRRSTPDADAPRGERPGRRPSRRRRHAATPEPTTTPGRRQPARHRRVAGRQVGLDGRCSPPKSSRVGRPRQRGEVRGRRDRRTSGILNSDDFSSLNPGFWVVFAGQYDTPVRGERRARRHRRQGRLHPPHRPELTGQCAASRSRPRRRASGWTASVDAAAAGSGAPSTGTTRGHRRGQRLDRVAALEHQPERRARPPRTRAAATPSSPAKPASVSVHVASGSARWASKPGRDQHELAAPSRGSSGATTCSTSEPCTASPDPPGTGRLTVKPSPGARADVGRRPGPRVQRRLVDRARTAPTGRRGRCRSSRCRGGRPSRGSAPARHAVRGARVRRGHRDVVEEAEAHRARRARRGGPAAAAPRRRTARRRPAARRPARRRRPPRAAPPRRCRPPPLVSMSIAPPPRADSSAIEVDVRRRVHARELVARRPRRLDALPAEPAVALHLRLEPDDPRRPLRDGRGSRGRARRRGGTRAAARRYRTAPCPRPRRATSWWSAPARPGCSPR